MFYYNKVCDGCSEIMLEGDDIVVCPDCGTPQHRECYKKNNECVNAHLHSEGFDWKAAHPEQEVQQEDPSNETEETQKAENSFGTESPGNETHSNAPNIPMPDFRIDGVYVNGQTFDANEDIGGATVKEVVTYTQVNSRNYLKRFIRNRHKKSFFLSWNWGAFFFGPAWFFYRKLYKVGAILLALAISATIAIIPLAPAIENAATKLEPLYTQFLDAIETNSTAPTEESQAEVDRLSAEIMTAAKAVMPHTLAVFAATYLVSQIIPALIANSLYRKKMLEDIKFAKEASSDENILKYSLIRRGGVSFLAGLFATLAASHLPNIIMSIVSYFTN